MSYTSISSMLDAARLSSKPLYAVICEDDCRENGYSAESSHHQIEQLWDAMRQSSAQYRADDRSNSGFIGGDAAKLRTAADRGALLGGTYFLRVTEEALKVAECNACMKRLVAAPTAGSSGAQGGCQAEIGVASAMAAAALTHIMGGTGEQCAHAFAIALGNLLGLVCDPVAGLVEIPCVKRNVIGAVNAVSAANMALAGITAHIPADEVIDAMGEIGDALPSSLRETGQGGLAATPTGRRIAESLPQG